MKTRKGFTLIELLIVITIIGILAVALVPRISSGPARARDVQRKADLQQLATAMELYYADNGEYPNESGYDENHCINDGGVIDTALSPYISIPTAPGSFESMNCDIGEYYYQVMSYSATGTNPSAYAMITQMEITSIDDSADGYFCDDIERTSFGHDDLSSYISGTIDNSGFYCPQDYAYYTYYH
ncbi:type II secretion system protein [Candidatus Peregrinibacteria bacterium]|jgi:prepilin-type N-terminal cleavage/methylation domain-containing protein|nr:type II secretion system protein [Candidatus Peregrinibacteria bacterium]MBT7483833.1 type II secretion system protein [Candidatus Peregrinibacteria bacterium]MBT7703442.1 type II secretion system protein [Candidatus Peregrinibacteria bacterium]